MVINGCVGMVKCVEHGRGGGFVMVVSMVTVVELRYGSGDKRMSRG